MKDVRAVSIICPATGCAAAQTLKGKRLLVSRGVALPLAECTMPSQCKCRYQKYADRRDEDDRRAFGSTTRGALFGISERRVKGRRAADR
jgi:hypothetical protein